MDISMAVCSAVCSAQYWVAHSAGQRAACWARWKVVYLVASMAV